MLKTLRVALAAVLAPPTPGGVASKVPLAVAPDPPALIAPALIPGPGFTRPPSGIPTLPETAIPSALEASIPAGAAAANPGRTALERLQADVPFATPLAGDLDGQKSFADRAFDFKLGVTSSDSGPAPVNTGPAVKSPGADDGGGPDYPSRTIKALGTTFRSVLFRPNVPVEAEIVRALDAAQKGDTVRIAVYEFANKRTLDELRNARRRGVDIKLVIDYSNVFPKPSQDDDGGYTPQRSREIWALMREGFDVKVLKGLGRYGINHNKICVVKSPRGSLGIFGSYNWKWTAERDHYENANFTDDSRRIDALGSIWNWLDTLAVKAVYDHSDGTIRLEDPGHQWPKTVPPPPQFPRDVHFNGIDLPFLVVSPASQDAANAEDELVRTFGATRQSIDVSIFALRSTKIVEELQRAKARGVAVRVIVDRSQAAQDSVAPYAQWLAFNGFEVRTLAGPDPSAPFQLSQKDHHKFSVLDGKLVETGSANYTKYAFIGNFENAHFLDDATDAQSYAFMFEHMWARAEPLPAPAQSPSLPSDEQLVKEIFPDQEPPIQPKPQPPDPEPSWPKPSARTIVFNGETVPSVILRPDTPVAPTLARLIKSAKKSVRISAYEFNLPGMPDALRWLRANKPKVKIEVLLDQSHVYTSGYDHTGQPRKPSPEIVALIKEGFDVLILKGKRGGIMHSKFLLIDAPETSLGQRVSLAAVGWLSRLNSGLQMKAAAAQAEREQQIGLVLRGSYNFATTAENNHYENVVISVERERVQNYLNIFKWKWKQAEKVDLAKLEEILARADVPARRPRQDDQDDEQGIEPASLGKFAPLSVSPESAARAPKTPPPPSNPETPIDLNGEKFQTEYFSPNGGIMDAWARAIGAAKHSIELGMFGFYWREGADAVVEALEAFKDLKKRNPQLQVRLVLDAGQAALSKFDKIPGERGSGIRVSDWFKQRGVPIRINRGPHSGDIDNPRDPMFEKMHSKYLIIDGKFVMTGSWNASHRADEDNFENATVLVDPPDVSLFVWDFERLFLRSVAPDEREPAADSLAPLAP